MITTFERSRLRPPENGSVVSIGVFDGVHLGHQEILAANVERAKELEAVPTVLTFREHPKGLLLGHAPRTLTTIEHRLKLFARAGIEHTVALGFDEELRSLSARDFVREILVAGLGAKSFVLGFDSKFGHDREGSPQWLAEEGYDVRVVDKVLVNGRGVSSTVIREAVELGDLASAAAMLGRAVSVFGQVVEGEKLGARIGFPTANLDLSEELHPPPGVYACRARITDEGRAPVGSGRGDSGEAYQAIVNIGFRPTVAKQPSERPQVEAHLLDFEGDLYGAHLELEFVAHLRDEERFSGPEELRAQIQKDAAQARTLLGEATPEAERLRG